MQVLTASPSVQEQFVAVRATAEPLRTKLGIPPSKRPPGQTRSAALLPLPLHIAYVELAAALEAYGIPGEISITGVSPPHKQLRP
jgi:hypothetical protein